MEELISMPNHSLIAQSMSCAEAKVNTNGDGFGIGWYGEKEEPGLYRDTQPAWGDENLLSIARQVKSPLFFAHVRASTGTATSRSNSHPFAVGKFMFMHNGQVGEYGRIRREIESLINDDFYRYRQGTTDSEALFLAMLSHGLDIDPVGAVQRVLTKTLEIMMRNEVNAPLRVAMALTDGERLYAIRCSSDRIVPSLYYRLHDRNLSVVSEPLEKGGQGWHEVPCGHIMVYGGDNAPCFIPLDIPDEFCKVA
ncbi:class II glutamine amidotransferase [Pseudovibrio sp. Tun.PSC04-5.I4]|uniref:class II glutamine amidotransferase n=1 Tax=Pseudovibrio sp. Tun.PSC04-5.I4 TaxID=1798213 RepID=UPI000A74167A|nr:class II glutamine amidotransferase [Pseudovibrio sp. Tun.PSC04-5.I4]